LTPVERTTVLELIRRLSVERRTTFAIVEHDMDVVFSLSDWIVVMNRGRVLAEGPPTEIRENREVREVYLGEEALA
jgi:branched-chain amino acid transport system ATP-binding protein